MKSLAPKDCVRNFYYCHRRYKSIKVVLLACHFLVCIHFSIDSEFDVLDCAQDTVGIALTIEDEDSTMGLYI